MHKCKQQGILRSPSTTYKKAMRSTHQCLLAFHTTCHLPLTKDTNTPNFMNHTAWRNTALHHARTTKAYGTHNQEVTPSCSPCHGTVWANCSRAQKRSENIAHWPTICIPLSYSTHIRMPKARHSFCFRIRVVLYRLSVSHNWRSLLLLG